jgi:hypothetical protein
MRKSIVLAAFLFCFTTLQGQSIDYNIVEGVILVSGTPSGSSYQNIDFTRKNIIIKRGAIANFKALIAKKLIGEQIKNEKRGNKVATLKRTDGLNFFRFFRQVDSGIVKVIESDELKTPFKRQARYYSMGVNHLGQTREA